MSEYRDERVALEERVRELEAIEADARARASVEREKANGAARALAVRPVRRPFRHGLYALAVLMIGLAGFFALAGAGAPGRAPLARCAEPKPALPRALRLYVWGSVVAAPPELQRALEGARCLVHVDARANGAAATVVSTTITCGAHRVHAWSADLPNSSAQALNHAARADLEHADIAGAYDLEYHSQWGDPGSPLAGHDAIDTRRRRALVTVGSDVWEIALSGPLRRRSEPTPMPR